MAKYPQSGFDPCVRTSRATRQWLAMCLTAALLAAPAVAWPHTLEALLAMPLERLLQLRVAPARTRQACTGEAATRCADAASGAPS